MVIIILPVTAFANYNLKKKFEIIHNQYMVETESNDEKYSHELC